MEFALSRRLSQATWPQDARSGLLMSFSHPQEPSNFTNFTNFTGPSPLEQHKTCVAGLSCLIGLEGTFMDGDRVMVLDTCSVASVVWSWPDSGRSLGADNQTFSWGTVAVSAAGGSYRLCWCVPATNPAGLEMPCDFVEDFGVDVGSMTLIGPYILPQTCVSGLICVIHGVAGTYLTSEDRYAVLDTCGNSTSVTVPRFGNGGFSSSISSSGTTVFFGQVATTSAGGQYLLCWCSSVANCTSEEDFEVPAVQLLIVGPQPLEQDRTCVSGTRCTFHLLGLLDALDRVFILDTCGQDHFSQHQLKLVNRFAGSGLGSSVNASGAIFSWSDSSSAGGQYRLCWCSSVSTCNLATDFKTDVGGLHLVGPSTRNEYTCISGQSCEIHGLVGHYLSVGDAYTLLDTCGTGWVSPVPRGRSLDAQAYGYGASVSWGSDGITAAGGALATMVSR